MNDAPLSNDASEPSPLPVRRRRRLLRRIGLILLLLLIGGELFARFKLGLGDPPLSQVDAEIEYLFKPDQECRRFGRRIHYNHYSMRSDDFPIHKSSPNELRVMIVGDSIVNGGALTDQSELATTLIQQRLSASLKRPVVVGNISAGSWGPPNQLAYLKRFGLFDADVLVLVLSSHDYADAPTFEPLVGVNPSFPSHRPVLALWEGVHRYLLPRLGWRWDEDPIIVPEGPPAQKDIDWCMKSLREMIDMARNGGAKVLAAQHLEATETLENPMTGHGVIAAELKKAGVEPIELGLTFAAARTHGEQLYRDSIHPTAAGQRAIADALTPAIEAALKTRSTTSPASAPVSRP